MGLIGGGVGASRLDLPAIDAGRRGVGSPWPALAAAVAISALARVGYFGGPFSVDEYAYVTLARELVAGSLPLDTVWFNRSPIVPLLYAVTVLPPVDLDLALDLLALALSAATAFLLYRLVAVHCTRVLGWLALALFALLSADPAMQGNGANMELPINLLAVAALSLAFPAGAQAGARRLFLAGLAIGVAVGLKETAAAFALPLLAACWHPRDRRSTLSRGTATAAGVVAPLLLVWAIYAVAGRSELLRAIWSFHAGYSPVKLVDLVPGPVLMMVERGYAFYVVWPLLVPAAWLLADPTVGGRFALAVRLSLVAACVAVVAPGFFFAHRYLHLQPPLVLATCVWLAALERRGVRRAALAAVGVALVAWTAALELRMASGQMPLVVRRLSPLTVSAHQEKALGRALAASAAPGDRLFVFGWAPSLYAHSALRPAAADIWGWSMGGQLEAWHWGMEPWLVERTRRALVAAPPEWIVVADHFGGGEVDRAVAEMLPALYRELDLGVGVVNGPVRPLQIFHRVAQIEEPRDGG